MKILHISTFDTGGAGLCCIRIHKALLAAGIESKVLVLNKSGNDPSVFRFITKKARYPRIYKWIIGFLRLVFLKLQIPLSRYQSFLYNINQIRNKIHIDYSLPLTEINISDHNLISECDLVHLHWISGFIDYPSFFLNIKKPVIWTQHDENLYYGGFHYTRDYDLFSQQFKEIEGKLITIKKNAVKACKDLTIVSLSGMMNRLSSSNEIVRERKHYIIHNPVDGNIFNTYDKSFCRSLFNIPADKKVILFVAFYLNDKRKGFIELTRAVELLDDPDIHICAVGEPDPAIKTSVPVHYLGQITDQRFMSLVYSCSDIFALPSFQEAFAQTPLEAMACGIPVVAFPCSGIDELLNENNGIKCKDFSITALAEGIQAALKIRYNKDEIRNYTIRNFGSSKIASDYVKVYENSLSKRL